MRRPRSSATTDPTDFRSAPVNYAAVGATQSEEILRFPPQGFRSMQVRSRIGHGDARWDDAWERLFTWAVQRDSGFEVTTEQAAEPESGYFPVQFDEAGNPVAAAWRGGVPEQLFGADGSRFLAAGDTATLEARLGPFRLSAPVRVVYTIQEPTRRGFAYGTLPGHPVRGEEAFVLERTTDGSVWFTVRAFSRPATLRWWLVAPLLRLGQRLMLRRYVRALSGPLAE